MIRYGRGVNACRSLSLGFRIFTLELHLCLFQNPAFNSFVVDTQKVQWTNAVMFLCSGARFVALNLRHNARRYFQPL